MGGSNIWAVDYRTANRRYRDVPKYAFLDTGRLKMNKTAKNQT